MSMFERLIAGRTITGPRQPRRWLNLNWGLLIAVALCLAFWVRLATIAIG